MEKENQEQKVEQSKADSLILGLGAFYEGKPFCVEFKVNSPDENNKVNVELLSSYACENSINYM